MNNTEVYNTLKVSSDIEKCLFPELLDIYLGSDWYKLENEIKYFRKIFKELDLGYEHKFLNIAFMCHVVFKNPVFFKNLYEIIIDYNIYPNDIVRVEFKSHLRQLYNNRNHGESCIASLNSFYNLVYGYGIERLKGKNIQKERKFRYLKYIIIDGDNIFGISTKTNKLNRNKFEMFDIYNISKGKKLKKIHKIKAVDKLNEMLLAIYLGQNYGTEFELTKDSERYCCDFSDIKDIVNIDKPGVSMITVGGKYNFLRYGFGR